MFMVRNKHQNGKVFIEQIVKTIGACICVCINYILPFCTICVLSLTRASCTAWPRYVIKQCT